MKFESPNNEHRLSFEWKGELGMSGPEYGTMIIDDNLEIRGTQPSVVFSEDSKYVAFPALKGVDTGPNYAPDRNNVGFRIILLNLENKEFKYLSGNKGYADYQLQELSNGVLRYFVNGELKSMNVQKVNWKKS
ncbi:MAG: hypothetical protein JAY99_01695 [Candidatus Thiodiazotropha lotti]|nr:hypothetical protein [Candidatus Thiodiazotropha lotti]MCG7998215.1 hypothetical protein [Candidatus Thiodiazotropha lotti]MCW4182844.1 hypothetical protein [Candidatus Thiodiazotropha weberae]MCW4189981.1 hypothetical protein [Candidatus Thiodiazotropha weberae]